MKRLSVALTVLLLLIAAVFLMGAVGEPYPGKTSEITTYLYYPATTLSGSTTVRSDSPRSVGVNEITRISKWHSADIFVSGDVTPTKVLTVVVQFSPDGTNWADAEYQTTATNSSGTQTVNANKYRLVFSSDAVKMLRVPLSGEWMRFEIQHTGIVTPTIWATLRSD